MTDGGYDAGYRASPCFWGRDPGSLVVKLSRLVSDFQDARILDLGCGEGKNSIYFAGKGAQVHATDISDVAIANARRAWPPDPRVTYELADARDLTFASGSFDIVIAYGLLHCLPTPDDISRLLTRIETWTREGGYCLICTFNDRRQEITSAHPDLHPCLLPHGFFANTFRSWSILECTDQDLTEAHPPDFITHTHSLTRLIAQKCRR